MVVFGCCKRKSRHCVLTATCWQTHSKDALPSCKSLPVRLFRPEAASRLLVCCYKGRLRKALRQFLIAIILLVNCALFELNFFFEFSTANLPSWIIISRNKPNGNKPTCLLSAKLFVFSYGHVEHARQSFWWSVIVQWTHFSLSPQNRFSERQHFSWS